MSPPVLAERIGPPVFPTLAVEDSLRAGFFRPAGQTAAGGATNEEKARLVRETAVFLEVMLASSMAHELGASEPGGALGPHSQRDEDLVLTIETRIGRSLRAIMSDAKEYLHIDVSGSSERNWIPLAILTRRVRSVLDACPIDEIEQSAAVLESQDWGHRARVAFDGLQALLFRTDERCVEQLRIAGSAYEKGHISVEEVAKLLAVHPVDALAMLDQAGFHRPIELLEIAADARAKIFERMRTDRLSRSHAFEPSAEMIARDVVASERIEGVDARRWIPREGP